MKNIIGIIGASAGDGNLPNETALSFAYSTGRLIAENGAVLICGGRSGIMEAACKGASEAGGITVGYLPGMDKSEANPYVDIVLPTGIGLARNVLTVRASDVVIMISGGTGTLNELTIAVNEHCVPAIVLTGTGGWADRIRDIAYDGMYLDERRKTPILFASSPEEAVKQALKLCSAKVAG
jgi:uncharacterized protein (TIGR00725 family)